MKDKIIQKITPFLWFDNQAEEAMNFYVSVFKNSEIVNMRRYGDAGPGPKGQVMTGTFRIEGQEFSVCSRPGGRWPESDSDDPRLGHSRFPKPARSGCSGCESSQTQRR